MLKELEEIDLKDTIFDVEILKKLLGTMEDYLKCSGILSINKQPY